MAAFIYGKTMSTDFSKPTDFLAWIEFQRLYQRCVSSNLLRFELVSTKFSRTVEFFKIAGIQFGYIQYQKDSKSHSSK